MYKDEEKTKLYLGLCKHFSSIPKFIVLRTVELASTSGKAFDALYDFKMKNLPVCWSFEKEKWVTKKIEIH